MSWRGGGGEDGRLVGWLAGGGGGKGEGRVGEYCSRSMQGGCADYLPLGLIT
jgi:hypothetical protein